MSAIAGVLRGAAFGRGQVADIGAPFLTVTRRAGEAGAAGDRRGS